MGSQPSRLLELCKGQSAIFSTPRISRDFSDLPGFVRLSVGLRPAGRINVAGSLDHVSVRAQGSGLTADEAMIPALGEAIERFCSVVYTDDQFISASANDLAGHCLDLETVASVSFKEASHPKCRLRRPLKDEPIRWVRGVSLTSKRLVWLPAIMVFSRLKDVSPSECFWFPISTGCAAHTDLHTALCSGIYEVAERDAIALTWLQMLQLPEIELDDYGKELRMHVDLCRKASIDVDFRFFNATTDVGIPIVYGVRLSKNNEIEHTVVACSASFTFENAICKVIRDLVTITAALSGRRDYPSEKEDFNQIWHGATYMAHRERLPAFDFLLATDRIEKLSTLDHGRGPVGLDELISNLRRRGMNVYAVDLTTAEAETVGVKVVRTIIPELQPLSFSYLAQYKGHERLYRAPIAMGYGARTEDNLNQWPQPFA